MPRIMVSKGVFGVLVIGIAFQAFLFGSLISLLLGAWPLTVLIGGRRLICYHPSPVWLLLRV